MRSIIKFFLVFAGLAVFLAACDKVDDMPVYGNGTTSVLSASATTVAPQPADSNNTALTLNWTNANYATDSAHMKYTIEMDSAGKNFARADRKVVVGQLSTGFLAKELNSLLLARGYAFNVPVDMDVRMISSYVNNNERLTSNTIRIRMTPYKIPPKVALPASGKLFIVGGATQGGWNNPVPVPSQELNRIDETTFGGIFQLTAGQSYLILPINGDWNAKYGGVGSNNSNNPDGDNFKEGGSDLMSPAATGWYKLIFDFQQGKFTVTPFNDQHGLPAELFIVGGATPGGWNNPVPVPSQRFTRVNSTKFEIATLALTPGEKYLLLPENGNWNKKFGAVDGAATPAEIGLGGPMKPEGADIPAPAQAGNYKITVDFATGKYTLVKL
ncbi:MAG TPA: SusE domain-containing protein [Flavisolibacter sp.]|nr:SusE domain-containing protein [Flavisolibacter sp.]